MYRPCYCHSTQAPHQEAGSWLYQKGCPPAACPRACLLPAQHHRSAPACPWESCKASCQESQTPQTQTGSVPCLLQAAGTKQAKAALKAPLDTLPRTPGWVMQAPVSSIHHPAEESAQAQQGDNLLEGNPFSVSSSQKDHFKVSSDQNIPSPSTCPSFTWLSSRPT